MFSVSARRVSFFISTRFSSFQYKKEKAPKFNARWTASGTDYLLTIYQGNVSFMKKITMRFHLTAVLFGIMNAPSAANYTYELSAEQPWAEGGSTTTTTNYVTVRSYVPGSNTLTYKSVPVYVSTYISGTNALGDVVGSVYNVYGSGTTAFIDPYNASNKTIIYPAVQILHTELLAINDDRLAIGTYYVLGGHDAGKGFIYDADFDQYTELVAPNTEWTYLSDINNSGQVLGTSINNGGATRKGFVYDCAGGFSTVDVPGSSWTVPVKIDDEGNIYGEVSGIADAAYFIARPDFFDIPSCLLVPRDDIAEPVVFNGGIDFEMSGDSAVGVKIADFDGGGVNDLLIYHEPGKTILYLGEAGFTEKIKYYGDEFNTLAEGIDIATEWDFNNDGWADKVKLGGNENWLYLSKADSIYHYVPQQLPSGNLRFGDLNGDALVDYVTFNGSFASIVYQVAQGEGFPDPDPIVDPTPVTEPDPAIGGDVQAIDPSAEKVELSGIIDEVNENSVLLTSGRVLWFNTDTIIKFNDTSGFDVGQKLEFKAWANPDGTLIAIKVEVV